MTQIKTKEINLCNLRNLWLENQTKSVVKNSVVLETIARPTGFEGEIVWDTSKPNGQPRRKLDVSRAREMFGFETRMSFAEGLQQTIQWYMKASR
jgi:nucleoside-diphosphate-sugar epimerase